MHRAVPLQMQYAALDAATLLYILDFFTHWDFAERSEPLSVDALLLHVRLCLPLSLGEKKDISA
jgi:hypothetical protein